MSHSQFYPTKDTWYEKWQKAKKAGESGIMAFFTDLYDSRNSQPHWDKVFNLLQKTHSEEYLEFFAANLERIKDKEFTLLKWKSFYNQFQLGKNIPVINITDSEHKALRSLNQIISEGYKDGDVIDFENTHVNFAIISVAKPKAYTGNQLLVYVSAKLLTIIATQEKTDSIDRVLSESEKVEEKIEKEKVKAKDKGKEKERDKGKGKEKKKEKEKPKEKEEKAPKKKW